MTPRPVITGIGQSEVGRRLARSGLALTVDAAKAALADAGLSAADIDGVSTYPGFTPASPAFSPVGIGDLAEAMGLQPSWWSGGGETPGQLGAIVNAYAAVLAGLARHVLCFRTVKEGAGGAAWRKSADAGADVERAREGGELQYLMAYDAISAANWIAIHAQRHFDRYGTTREQLGQIAVTARRNAALNPKALFRAPLTLDDYLAARMISTPLCLLDCDAPTDASTVVIVSAPDAAADLRQPPVRIEGVGGGAPPRFGWDQGELLGAAAAATARSLWARSALTPADVDVALVYDGFSFLALEWIEALGFCGPGEGGGFIEGGARIALDGELPINPHGGQLSGGRTHGFGFVHEAVVQLRGKGGARQVPREPRVAAVTNGGGPFCGAMLLQRD